MKFKVKVLSLDVDSDMLIFNLLLAMVSSKNMKEPHTGKRFCLVDRKGDVTPLKTATVVFDRLYGEGWHPIQDWALLGQFVDKFDVDSVKNADATYDASIGEQCPIQGKTRMEAIAKAIIINQLGYEIELDLKMKDVL